jgi:hypothetical protein
LVHTKSTANEKAFYYFEYDYLTDGWTMTIPMVTHPVLPLLLLHSVISFDANFLLFQMIQFPPLLHTPAAVT